MQSEEKDDKVIWVINELRLATRKQIARVLPDRNNSWLHESLQRMVRQKKLYSARPENPAAPFIYATYDISKRTDFDHDLPLSDIHVALWDLIVEGEWHQPQHKLKDDLNTDVWTYLGNEDEDVPVYIELETGKNRWDQIDKQLTLYVQKRKETQEPFNVAYILKNEKIKTVEQYRRRFEKFFDPKKESSLKLFMVTTLEQITTKPREPIFRTAFDNPKEPCYLLPPRLLK